MVTVPFFSPQPNAGNLTWASAVVSVSAMQSDTTTNGQLASAARTLSGRLKLLVEEEEVVVEAPADVDADEEVEDADDARPSDADGDEEEDEEEEDVAPSS